MVDEPAPDPALELRASDTDRELVADRLREAAAHGRITMDELEDRLERTYHAKTYAELQPITRDLPATGAPAPVPDSGPLPGRVGATPARRRWSIAVMSGATRRGSWVLPAKYNAFAFWGGVQLDLRDAQFAARESVIRASAVMGGVEIIVPDDVEVHVEGFGFMGGYEDSPLGSHPPAGAPIVRITGIAFWGGVAVKRRRSTRSDNPPGELNA